MTTTVRTELRQFRSQKVSYLPSQKTTLLTSGDYLVIANVPSSDGGRLSGVFRYRTIAPSGKQSAWRAV